MNFVVGRCFCKTVQFEIHFPTDFVSHCHCESCRKSHGAAFVTWSGVPVRQFKYISGESFIKSYNSSPAVKWSFCSACGTSLLYKHEEMPDKIYFTVSNIEGSLDRQPDSHVSYEEHVTWFKVKDELPKFKEKSNERLPE